MSTSAQNPVQRQVIEELTELLVLPSGQPRYSPQVMRRFAPLLVLGDHSNEPLDAELVPVMAEFFRTAGIDAHTPREHTENKIRAYIEADDDVKELNEKVLSILSKAQGQLLAENAGTFARQLGTQSAKTPLGHGAAPQGSMKGAQAQFRRERKKP